MKSELHAQLVQYLDNSTNFLDGDSKKEETMKWKGRTISEAKGIRSEINRILEPNKDENITDKDLLERVCNICNIDAKQKESLELLCNASPKEGAEALTEVIINTATTPPMSEAQFNKELQDWVNQGEPGNKRKIIAVHIGNAYKKKSRELNLMNQKSLDSLPNVLNQLTQLEKINLSKSNLKSLPDCFQNLTALKSINLSNTPLEHFPKSLYAIKNKAVQINIDNTPITNTFITPAIKRKISEDGWEISGLTSNHDKTSGSFDKSYQDYVKNVEISRKLGNKPTDLVNCQRVSQNESLDKETEAALLQNDNQKQTRVQSQQDLEDRLASHDLNKVRLLILKNEGVTIMVYGLACPYKHFSEKDDRTKEQIENDDKKTHATNLPFMYNEIDTLITLVPRDEHNEPANSIKDYAGTKSQNPIKNVFSIPIPDFQPPRLEHYLTLAEEMSDTTASEKPKSIGIFCGYGEGRTGTLLAASQVINTFKNLDHEAKKQLLNTTRDFTPDTFNGTFSYLDKNFKTTPFVGNIIQNLRELEKDRTAKQVGISVETPAQIETLEILQNMLAISEKLKDTPPISDEQILDIINEQNYSPETLEEFFQIDYSRPAKDVILESVKHFHGGLTKT